MTNNLMGDFIGMATLSMALAFGGVATLYGLSHMQARTEYKRLYKQAAVIADTNRDGKLDLGERVKMYEVMGLEVPEPNPRIEQLIEYIGK